VSDKINTGTVSHMVKGKGPQIFQCFDKGNRRVAIILVNHQYFNLIGSMGVEQIPHGQGHDQYKGNRHDEQNH
jgi:hypothetical protein